MRIAVVIDTWFPHIGGGQINAWEITRRIAKKHQVEIITRNSGKDNLKIPKNIKIKKLGPPSNPESTFSKILFCVASFFYLYFRDYDLVHAHAFLPGITARLFMVTKAIPAVFTVHGTSLGTNLLSPLKKFIEKFILLETFYSAQISTSRDFLKLKNINNKVFYIPSGVNVADFDKVTPKKFKNLTIIFVGRLHEQKNLANLILSIDSVINDFPDLTLLIVGEGPQKRSLLNLARDKKISKHVKFLGEKTGQELIKLYKSSHLFILPSIYEGQPLTLLEAWAAKLPVIVTKTGDCQFLIKNGINGFLIDNPLDTSEIANAIKSALTAKNLENMGLTGYNLVAKNFSWEKSGQKTLEVYEKLAAKFTRRQTDQN